MTLAFVGLQTADADHFEHPGLFLRGRLVPLRLDAAVDDVGLFHSPGAEVFAQELAVVLRNGGHKSRAANFWLQHGLVHINIMRVNGDAVGDAGQVVDDPGGQGGVGGIVGVDVGDAFGLHPLGHERGFWEDEQGAGQKLGAGQVAQEHAQP